MIITLFFFFFVLIFVCFFFQAEDGIRDLVRSRGLGDVYKRQDTGSGAFLPMLLLASDPEEASTRLRKVEIPPYSWAILTPANTLMLR